MEIKHENISRRASRVLDEDTIKKLRNFSNNSRTPERAQKDGKDDDPAKTPPRENKKKTTVKEDTGKPIKKKSSNNLIKPKKVEEGTYTHNILTLYPYYLNSLSFILLSIFRDSRD